MSVCWRSGAIDIGGGDCLSLGLATSGVVVALMAVLAWLLSRHYALHRRTHTLWWAVSFWLAFIAAATDFSSHITGHWGLLQYRVYLFSAATLVTYMGAGTVYLFSRRFGHIYVALMSLFALAMARALYVTPISAIHMLPAGEKAQGFVPSSLAPYFGILSGVGALALFAGALYSYLRTRAAYNLWIALGALIFSAGGAVGELAGVYELFYVFQAVGSLVLYLGVVGSFSGNRTSGKI